MHLPRCEANGDALRSGRRVQDMRHQSTMRTRAQRKEHKKQNGYALRYAAPEIKSDRDCDSPLASRCTAVRTLTPDAAQKKDAQDGP